MPRMSLICGVDDTAENVVIEMHMDGKCLGRILYDPATAELHANAVLKYAALCKPKKPAQVN